MPTKSEYPLPKKKYKARQLKEIRGMPHRQLKPGSNSKTGNHISIRNRRTAYEARRRMKARIEKEIDAKAMELQELDRQVAKREEILDLATKAPTVKEMRGAVAALFKEENLDPIKEMIKMVKARGKRALPPHQKAMLLKELAQYQAPKPKSVDIQADMDMNVNVGMVDFRGASKRAVTVVETELTDEDYDEFDPIEDI